MLAVDRLRDMTIHSRLDTTFAISGHGMGRPGNDWHVKLTRSFIFANSHGRRQKISLSVTLQAIDNLRLRLERRGKEKSG